MQEAVIKDIRAKIARSKYGKVFFVSSFPKNNIEYVTKLLAMFEKEGLITRISKGVYVKVRKTRFGILYPSAYEIVTKIAKRDKAIIIPTGATAANRLGLSTQVPMNSVFLTSGSSRKLTLRNRTVTLKHGAPKNFAFKDPLIQELVQALRNIGEKNITAEHKKLISALLNRSFEKPVIEHDLLLTPIWMRDIIQPNIQKTKP